MGLKELRSTVSALAKLAGPIGSGPQVQVNTQVNVDMSGAVAELATILRPRADRSVPKQLRRHIEDGPPDSHTLKRLEQVRDDGE